MFERVEPRVFSQQHISSVLCKWNSTLLEFCGTLQIPNKKERKWDDKHQNIRLALSCGPEFLESPIPTRGTKTLLENTLKFLTNEEVEGIQTEWNSFSSFCTDFHFQQKISDIGPLGFYYRVGKKNSLQSHVVKILNWEKVIEWNLGISVISEIMILKHIKHPNLVRCDDCFVNDDFVFILYEHCEVGNLFEVYSHSRQSFSEEQIIFIAHETLQALRYLHNLNIIHGDVKARNLLLTCQGGIKLANFDSCLHMQTEHMPNWMAPEVISLTFSLNTVE
eukprot:TRINITY_DN14054_c0_g1_i1.p1 TRINITY_DN14054_c0_g1~~TRINITY_DN14054_c0_g1_i1.p1  ORF type:complete len:278 (-),score=50.58 TRINITY_DN14054_c0_g1_i1:28-861(-)